MATRNVSKHASALAKARERRRALDKSRDEQDQRIEEATAVAMVALEARADAERALEAATGQVGESPEGVAGRGRARREGGGAAGAGRFGGSPVGQGRAGRGRREPRGTRLRR